MKTLLSLFVLFIGYTLTQENADVKQVHFLNGTWKMEKKESYETWKLDAEQNLEGEAYKMNAGAKKINENLSIKAKNGKLVYSATVLNQNGGKPVEFVLNNSVKEKLSFENLEHDFPKKIQYTKLNDSTIFVAVLGGDDKGFSYKMLKQK